MYQFKNSRIVYIDGAAVTATCWPEVGAAVHLAGAGAET